jgi:sodium-dependent dicarboxylate transporter 2/3/5
MLPMATPPNAIVFASGYIRVPQMVKAGIILNLISVILLVFVFKFIMPHIF